MSDDNSELYNLAEEIDSLRAELDALRELLRDIRPDSYNPGHIRRIDAALAERKQ